MKKLIHTMIILLMVFAPFIASPPQKAEAAPSSSFNQTILPPSCYDLVSQTGPTVDYIATFDCVDRTPDGEVYIPNQTPQD